MKENLKKEFLGSGWGFPVTFSSGNYQLHTTQYEKNIEDSIDIIMQTNFGERPMRPEFGSGLQEFFFQKIDKALEVNIKEVVKTSLLENEPRITVENVVVRCTDLQLGLLNVTIEYVYNTTNTRHNYVYPFHVKEGTNL